MQGYTPKASDELELVLGDYIYIDEKEFDSSSDGWVHGTSWLTGVSGCLPAVYTRRTAESDAWTLHRAISLGNNSTDNKSESDSNLEMARSYPHEDASQLGFEKSEESYTEWAKFWEAQVAQTSPDVLTSTADDHKTSSSSRNGDAESKLCSKNATNGQNTDRRWYFAMRHGERVDLTYGQWVPYCFDENGTYVRKDLNMPLSLPDRAGGKDSYAKDTPLTRVGRLQAQLVGEGLRLAGISLRHVYASAALRCVETAQELLRGLQDPTVKIRVEPGLFEYKVWHSAKGLAPFMTPLELHKAGFSIDLNYKPYVDLDVDTPETIEEFYDRHEKVIHSVVKDTDADVGNVMFVGHAVMLDIMVFALKRLEQNKSEYVPYQLSKHLLRVPYCALGAVKNKPWEVVCPPCPPSINSSSGRYDWRLLLDV